MSGSITKFITDETGQGLIEYGGVLAFAAGLILFLVTGGGGGFRGIPAFIVYVRIALGGGYPAIDVLNGGS